MKRLQKILTSVLLFSFTFLIFHDFVIAQVKPSIDNSYIIKHESCLETNHAKDLSFEIHNDIHTFIAIDFTSLSPIDYDFSTTKPFTTELVFNSYFSYVLERPPLV